MSSSKRRVKTRSRKRRNGKTKKRDGNTEEVVSKLNRELINKFKYDPRGPNVLKQALESMVVNPSMPIQVKASSNAFSGIIMAAISTALSRGWSLNTFDDNYIYWAWVYQVRLLIQAARGGVPFSGNVPRWLNLVVQAVIKTSVPYRGGEASYAMNIEDDLDDSFEQLLGPPAFKHVYSMGIKTSSVVNGLYPIITSPSAYSDEKGEEATQNLWLFLQSSFSGKMHAEMHKMEPFNTKNCMTDDVSAFAWFNNAPGGGFKNTGAWFKQLYHEVAIKRPVFSVFSPTDPDLFVNRAQVKLHIGSGDSITLGGLLVDGLSEKELSFKTAAVAKYIDFLQFADVYARVIRQALTLRTQTAAFIENVKNDSAYFVKELQCPLTFQNFQLLLRATLMLVYTDTIKYQGTYPRSASGPSDNEFVVYGCGIQTCPIPIGNMMLMPQIFQENVLALRSRTVKAGRSGQTNPVQNYGVLGQYNNDRLVCEDYLVTYTIDDEEVIICPFAEDEGEVEVSLIDGYYSLTPDGYCAINDPVALVQLAASFNSWIQEQGDHFRMLNSITTDSGIDACSQIGMTLHWKSSDKKLAFKKKPVKQRGDKKKEEEEEKDDRPVSRYAKGLKRIRITNSVYADREMIALSCGYELFTPIWTQFQQYWVQAINLIDPPATVGDNTGYLRMSAFLREPRQLSLGTGSTMFATIAERNESYAALCVKTKFAQDTSQERLLAELTARGEGGVLGAMTGAMAGAVGHAAVDVGSELLGKVIPW